MTPQQFQKQLQRHQQQLEQAFQRTIPTKVAIAAEQHFRDNFRKGGFVNGGLRRWKRSKRESDPKNKDRAYKTLLSRRNHLYSSVKHRTKPYTAIVENNVPYAAAHNEGTNNAGRGHHTTIPKRQFIGDSRELTDKAKKIITQDGKSNSNWSMGQIGG